MTEAPLTLPELLRWRADQDPEAVAISVAGEQELRYGEWSRNADRAANALAARGVRRGDRIAVRFGGLDWTGYAVAYHAVQRAGATTLHLDDVLPEVEVRRRLAECRATGVVHGPGLAVVGPHWTVELSDLDGRPGPPEWAPGPADLADILYTSGTTGPARAVEVSHANLAAVRSRPKAVDDMGGTSYLLVPMPLGTTTSQGVLGMALFSPATLMLSPAGDARRVAELVDRHRIGSVMVTPAMAVELLDVLPGGGYDLSCVHTLATSSAPFPPAVATALLALMPGATLAGSYASVQAVPAACRGGFDPARPWSLGRPVPGAGVRVTDRRGDPLPPGRVGEIWLRPGGPRRRFLDPAVDRESCVDGWIRMGDLGELDADGGLVFFDRADDAIRCGGRLVSSVRVEAALHEHPAVRAAGVVGVPDGELGQMVAAAVELRDRDALPAVREFLATRLARPERPAVLVPVDRLPRNRLGKLLKRRLRVQLAVSPSRS